MWIGNSQHLQPSIVAKSAFPIHGIAGYLVNNWELAPLIHTTSGTPINVTTGSDISLIDVNNDRPNQLPGVNPYNYTKINSSKTYAGGSYLNQAAFARSPLRVHPVSLLPHALNWEPSAT